MVTSHHCTSTNIDLVPLVSTSQSTVCLVWFRPKAGRHVLAGSVQHVK